jgi:hypothetical protein
MYTVSRPGKTGAGAGLALKDRLVGLAILPAGALQARRESSHPAGAG